MKFKDLKKSLSEKMSNIYILSCGQDKEDLYLKASAIGHITKKAVTNFEDLNISVFSEENSDKDMIKKALETLPFLSDKRLVLIKESENVKYDDILKVLTTYIDNPIENIVLVIDEKEESKFKELEKTKNVEVVDCSRLDREIVYSFVAKSCKNGGIQIETSAINKILDFTDGYMTNVDLELRKLMSYKYNEKIINENDVENLVEKSDEYQIFELTNALFSGNGDRALYIVSDIIKNKKNISSILGLIYTYIRRLFYIKVSKEIPLEISKKLEIKEFAVKMMKNQSDKVSAKKLKETLILCKDIDYNIKSGKIDLISGIYNLIFSILV